MFGESKCPVKLWRDFLGRRVENLRSKVAQSCAQQRITLRFVPGIIASRQFTQPLLKYIYPKHITIHNHTSRRV